MVTIDFTIKPTITGKLVVLRPVAVADVPKLRELMADREVSRLTGSIHSDEESDARRWSVAQLEEVYRRWTQADDRVVWVIVDRSTGDVVGESVLNDLDLENRSCGFRIWIAGARDRGLGTEATWLSVHHALIEQGLNRVELEVFDFNPRARRVYEKVGFVHEGTRRQSLRYNNEWVDASVMAILARDWTTSKHG